LGKRDSEAPALSLKNIFYNEIPSAELRDIYSKQAKVYKRDGA
jgi:hypothetical protein